MAVYIPYAIPQTVPPNLSHDAAVTGTLEQQHDRPDE